MDAPSTGFTILTRGARRVNSRPPFPSALAPPEAIWSAMSPAPAGGIGIGIGIRGGGGTLGMEGKLKEGGNRGGNIRY